MGLFIGVVALLVILHLGCVDGLPLRVGPRTRRLLVAAISAHLIAMLIGGGRLLLPTTYVLGAVVFGRALLAGTGRRNIAMVGLLGGLMNAIPIAVVGHMPTALAADADELGREPFFAAGKHGHDSVTGPLRILTDWVQLDQLQAIVSLGDIAMLVALLWAGVSAWPAAIRLPRLRRGVPRSEGARVYLAHQTQSRQTPAVRL